MGVSQSALRKQYEENQVQLRREQLRKQWKADPIVRNYGGYKPPVIPPKTVEPEQPQKPVAIRKPGRPKTEPKPKQKKEPKPPVWKTQKENARAKFWEVYRQYEASGEPICKKVLLAQAGLNGRYLNHPRNRDLLDALKELQAKNKRAGCKKGGSFVSQVFDWVAEQPGYVTSPVIAAHFGTSSGVICRALTELRKQQRLERIPTGVDVPAWQYRVIHLTNLNRQ